MVMRAPNKILLSVFIAAGLAQSQTPKIHGETANGKPIELPDAAADKVTLLILGFSKVAGPRAGVWEQHVSDEFGHDPHLAVYSVAMLESVPRLLRGTVKSGIESGTPKAKRDRMVTTFSGEAAWKQFTGAADDKVPYLVLLDGAGKTCWSGHGLFDEKQYEALRTVLKQLTSP